MIVARLSSLAGAFVLALVLSACTTSAEPWTPAPLSAGDRLSIYERSLDEQWGWVTSQYPEAVRPEVPDPVEITQATWDDTMAVCMRDIGYTVTLLNGGYSAEPAPGADPQSLAIGDYYCNASYPWEGTFDGLLSQEQLDALYTYYIEIVTPCLALSGRKVIDIPSRDSFVNPSYSWASWHPYYSTGSNGALSVADLQSTNARCPLEPSWHTGIMGRY